MPSANDFIPRLSRAATQEHRATIEHAFNVTANFALERQKIENNPNLSPQGRRDALAALVTKDHGPQFKKLAEVVARNRAAAVSARAQFRPAAAAPKDIHGEMRRDQIRTWLRSLPEPERMRRALADETIRAAVMDAGGYLSGLTDELHTQLIDYHIEKKFGAEIRHLDDLDEAIANVDAAIQVARSEVCKGSGIEPRQFLAMVTAEGTSE